MSLEQQIKDKALQLGFHAVGITDASPISSADMERFQAWLASGYAGHMRYLHRNLDKRFSPAALLAGAESVIVVALGYKRPPCSNGSVGEVGPVGTVAQYACYDDYHAVIRPLLHDLAAAVGSLGGPMRFRVCVDSAPLAERALAVRAGLGFIGLNHMLIHATLGPQVLLGELLTTVRLKADMPATGGCSLCRRCIEACPTGALQEDGQFDARRCISYLTMEHAGDIDPALAARMGNHLFGCDECTWVCPFRESASVGPSGALKYYPDRAELDLREILSMDHPSFEARFGASPVHRTGLEGLQRNANICLRNTHVRGES